MECPKCRHKIYLDLTLEDLIFCPYCDQRMIPPKDFNLCPACGGELPIGAEFCLKCGEKLVPEERPVIDRTPIHPPEHSREDIASLTTDEPTVVQEPGPAPIVNKQPTSERALPEKETRTAEEIAPVVREVSPVLERIVPPFVEKETLMAPTRTTFEVDEEAEPPVDESSYTAPAEPQPSPIPMPLIVPPQTAEAKIPSEFKQPPVYSGPVTADIMRTVNGGNGPVAPEPIETAVPSEFDFCIACGQKLPHEAVFCPRCGKSTALPGFAGAQPEPTRPSKGFREEAVKPADAEPVVRPLKSREVQSPEPPVSVPPPHVEPKYHPVSSREPMSNAMEGFAPSMPHHPNARTSGVAPLRKVWHNVVGWTSHALSQAWDFTKGQQKGFRELFSKLFEEREIIPVDMSSAEALKNTAKVVSPPVKRPIPRIYIILGVIVYIVLFVAIGITISRCSSG